MGKRCTFTNEQKALAWQWAAAVVTDRIVELIQLSGDGQLDDPKIEWARNAVVPHLSRMANVIRRNARKRGPVG